MKTEVQSKPIKNGKMFNQLSKPMRKMFNQWQLWVMVLIPMFFVILFQYIPMAGVIIAFKDYKYNTGIWFSKWVGLNNFKFLFASGDLARITVNTVGFNALAIAVSMVTSVVFAVLLYGFTSKIAVKFYQTISILPNYLSWVVISFVVYGFLSPEGGVLNNLLYKFGIAGVDWYSNPKPWWTILLICRIWHGTGMGSVLYYSTLLNVDESLFEAAKLDGANKFDIFKHIMVPCLMSIIILNFTLSVGGIFGGDFGLFYNVTKNSPALYSTTDIIPTYVYRLLKSNGEIGMSSAAGLLQSAVACILVVATNLIIRKYEPEKSLF